MKYLLDTCVISDYVKGIEPVVRTLLGTTPADIAVSTITRMEIHYGLLLNKARQEKLQPKLDQFFASVHVLPFNNQDAIQAAEIRSILHKRGRPIGPYDLLLAGTALAHALIFVTANTREFERVDRLCVENWNERAL